MIMFLFYSLTPYLNNCFIVVFIKYYETPYSFNKNGFNYHSRVFLEKHNFFCAKIFSILEGMR